MDPGHAADVTGQAVSGAAAVCGRVPDDDGLAFPEDP